MLADWTDLEGGLRAHHDVDTVCMDVHVYICVYTYVYACSHHITMCMFVCVSICIFVRFASFLCVNK